MGYKFFFGVGLLAVMLLGCLLVSRNIDAVVEPVTQSLEEAITQAGNDQMEQAASSIQKAKAVWQAHRGMFASLSNHSPMDDIDELMAEAESYGLTGCKDAFLAGCAKLKKLLDSISQDHRLTWWNFL